MNKNEIVQIEITALTAEGNGVGRYNGMAVFVPMTAVGDVIDCRIVKLKNSYAYGIIERVIHASPDRISVDCPVYSKCGGCVFRHISYEAELKAKERFVRDSFKRIGGFELESEPIIGCKDIYHYRNKAQFPVSCDSENCFYGFYSQRSHRVVKTEGCLLQPEIFDKIAGSIVKYQNKNRLSVYDEMSGMGLLRHIYLRIGAHSGEIMVTLVVTEQTHAYDRLAASLAEEYKQVKTVCLNINPEQTNVILGSKDICLYGDGKISDIMCGLSVEISSHSFYQVNTPAAETVYELAKEYAGLSGKETLLDLYCGIGTVGLSMADRVSRLIGVEVVPQAVEDARKNAARNGIPCAEFICGDAGFIATEIAGADNQTSEHTSGSMSSGTSCKADSKAQTSGGKAPDVIVVDPPRKGCDKATLDAVLKMSPKKLVYISCNHATAARDAAYLCSQGYKLEKYRPCDLFPRTGHVETVCLLSKLHADQHIEVELKMDELDLTVAESKATYEEIKNYVLEHSGLKVSSLYIAQVKQKCGIIERDNYNNPKSENAKHPQCSPKKEAAIRAALEHFKMI